MNFSPSSKVILSALVSVFAMMSVACTHQGYVLDKTESIRENEKSETKAPLVQGSIFRKNALYVVDLHISGIENEKLIFLPYQAKLLSSDYPDDPMEPVEVRANAEVQQRLDRDPQCGVEIESASAPTRFTYKFLSKAMSGENSENTRAVLELSGLSIDFVTYPIKLTFKPVSAIK